MAICYDEECDFEPRAMTTFLLESLRSLHCDIECLDADSLAAINSAERPGISHRDRLALHHFAHDRINEMSDKQRQCLDIYDNHWRQLEVELNAIAGEGTWAEFDRQLAAIRARHDLLSAAKAVNGGISDSDGDLLLTLPPRSSSSASADPLAHLPFFTASERSGKRVDLARFHRQYNNLDQFRHRRANTPTSTNTSSDLDYEDYLRRFHSFADIDRDRKLKSFQSRDYENYLAELHQYLTDFFHRIHPLVDRTAIEELIEREFEQQWTDRTVAGWFAAAADGETSANDATNDDNPLHCKYCDKSFAKLTVFEAHLTGKKHLKAVTDTDGARASSIRTGSGGVNDKYESLARSMAYHEFCICEFAHLLREPISHTIQFLQRARTITAQELDDEIRAEEAEESQSSLHDTRTGTDEVSNDSSIDADTDFQLSNPKNLPIGWDGRPIPYWLYRLNGLNQSFRCEICGGHVYQGPQAFTSHFSEPRHSWGMKCLGIPNIKPLWPVTEIEAVKALWSKMQRDEQHAAFNVDDEEEMEDSDGNVFKRKTFLELKRQGLI